MASSRFEAGVPGVSRLGLCIAGVELLPLCDWKPSASLGPVYCTFALLSSVRLLGTISGPAVHISAAIIWFLPEPLMPSSQQVRLGAYRQSFSLIDQDMLWSISHSRLHMVGENKSNVCIFQSGIYTGILDEIPKHLSLSWGNVGKWIYICVVSIFNIVRQLVYFFTCFVSISRFLNHRLPLKSRTINKDNCIRSRGLKWSTTQFH